MSCLLNEVLVLWRAAGELPRRDAESAVARDLPLLVFHLVLEHLRVWQVAMHRRLRPPPRRRRRRKTQQQQQRSASQS